MEQQTAAQSNSAAEHAARVDDVGGRYPYRPACTCGELFRGYVAEHAARLIADAHLAEHATPASSGGQASSGDPRVTHVGKPAAELTPAERRARRELALRVTARQPMITATSTRRAAWFVR